MWADKAGPTPESRRPTVLIFLTRRPRAGVEFEVTAPGTRAETAEVTFALYIQAHS